MPTLLDGQRVRVSETRIRLRANTVSVLTPAELSRVVDALADFTAIGIAATSERVGVRPAANHQHSDVQVAPSPGHTKTVSGAYNGATLIKNEFLRVNRLSYANPLDLSFLASITAAEAVKVVGLIKSIFDSPKTRLERAQIAEQEQIRTVIADATIEASVDEAYLRVDSAELDNALKEQKVIAKRLKNQLRQLELSERILNSPLNQLNRAELDALLNNTRVIRSIDIAIALNVDIEVDESPEG